MEWKISVLLYIWIRRKQDKIRINKMFDGGKEKSAKFISKKRDRLREVLGVLQLWITASDILTI
jgi:hypothetical protein